MNFNYFLVSIVIFMFLAISLGSSVEVKPYYPINVYNTVSRYDGMKNIKEGMTKNEQSEDEENEMNKSENEEDENNVYEEMKSKNKKPSMKPTKEKNKEGFESGIKEGAGVMNRKPVKRAPKNKGTSGNKASSIEKVASSEKETFKSGIKYELFNENEQDHTTSHSINHKNTNCKKIFGFDGLFCQPNENDRRIDYFSELKGDLNCQGYLTNSKGSLCLDQPLIQLLSTRGGNATGVDSVIG